MGRGFVALRNIEAGEVVLRNKPSSAVLDDDLLFSHCSACMQCCKETSTICSGCNAVVFCPVCKSSPGIMREHKEGECDSLRK
jgi:hypothetical protein